MMKAKQVIALLLAVLMMLALTACGSRNELTPIKSFVAVGDIIEFGAYEQDNDTSNGKEPIEWRVLAKEDNKILVISKYALDAKPYNTEWENVTWETCTLRTWLNETFLNEAFSGEEQSMIQTTEVSADKNPDYSTDPGNATKDKIFVLSVNEANEYFASDEARMCVPTAYAIANGAGTSDNCKDKCKVEGAATGWWWLRSPGNDQDDAARVDYDGGTGSNGTAVDDVYYCARPALWIDLEDNFNNIKIMEATEAAQNDGSGFDGNIQNDYAATAVDEIIEFGTYEQDNDISNGKEPIEWIVLERDGDKVLVISKYALDAQPYNNQIGNVTWEICTLRRWLNGVFLYAAFSEAEQSMIQTTEVSADKNPDYSTDPGNATKDKLFLLSINEANEYLASDEARMCVPTAYAIANGARTYDYFKVDGGVTCSCWLRSPGSEQDMAAGILNGGIVNPDCGSVSLTDVCVRPALWINLDGASEGETEMDNNPNRPTNDTQSDYATASVGDIIEFGTYEQDNDTSNGKEPIEWQVLERDGNKILVISKYALDVQSYGTEFEDVTWETCTLRTSLNGTFIYAAFSEAEQSMIQTTEVSADKNPDYSTDPGNATKDKIFLLSINEAEKYFASDEARMCFPTAYAIANEAYTFDWDRDGEAACRWWLRSPGSYQDYAVYVDADGSVDSSGDTANLSGRFVHFCVRPALWINLDA